MQKIKRTHIVLTCLLFALGAAVYLNWQLTPVNSSNVGKTKELGQAQYVNQTDIATPDTVVTVTGNLTKDQAEYFAMARTERQQSQDKILEISEKILSAVDSDDDAKEDAIEESAKVSGYFAQQSNIESILRAKGFTDCMCFISDDGCTVIILESEMENSSTLIVKDVVKTQTGLGFEKISIIAI